MVCARGLRSFALRLATPFLHTQRHSRNLCSARDGQLADEFHDKFEDFHSVTVTSDGKPMLVPDRAFAVRHSWESHARCTVVLIGAVMLLSV